jgi:thiol:disulfide interchange protein DsbA
MTKPFHVCAALLAMFALAGCGDSPSESQRTTASPAVEQAAPGPASDPSPATAAPQATAEAAPSEREQLSEVDDELETAEPGVSASTTPLPIRMAAASTPATSGKFQEGRNYKTLVPAQPTDAAPGEVEVVEVFWYGCSHCFALDPSIENWKEKSKPDYIEFRRLPAMWNDTLRMHARMFFTAEALGKLEELHPIIFRAMHVDRNMLNTPDKIRDLFTEHGVSGADFDKTFTSFAVETKLQRADVLNRRYRVTSVPMIVVNGKYTTDVGSAGGTEQLFELIGELASHEKGSA